MIPASTFTGQRVAVFGLGRSGLATCRSLVAGGATVLAWDENERSRAAAEADGIPLTDLSIADWSDITTLVLAPGVPLTHPAPHWTVNRAREAGAQVIGDVEVFARERAKIAPDTPFIAITGTNGKSTTTALIAHVLSKLGRNVQMGGNIGTAILSLEPLEGDGIYVIEMSSYQIDLTQTINPTVGMLLNLSPDHIDRHGTFEHYAAVKTRLVEGAATAVVGTDDIPTADIARRIVATHPSACLISTTSRLPAGRYLEDGRIYDARDGARAAVLDMAELPNLRGRHNAANAMATLAALDCIGIGAAEIAPALASFPGLAHRLETVGQRGSVLFVNDSKATNADSTAVALASFPGDIYWICGGRAKDGGVATLEEYFPRIARAYLVGEAEDAFATQLDGNVPFARCGTLEIAAAAAARDAAASNANEPVVLLAPACASFDQYPSFEARGDHFREIIHALPGVQRPGEAA